MQSHYSCVSNTWRISELLGENNWGRSFRREDGLAGKRAKLYWQTMYNFPEDHKRRSHQLQTVVWSIAMGYILSIQILVYRDCTAEMEGEWQAIEIASRDIATDMLAKVLLYASVRANIHQKLICLIAKVMQVIETRFIKNWLLHSHE